MSLNKDFVRAFEELRQAVGDFPSRLVWAMRNDPRLLFRVQRVASLADAMESEWLKRKRRTILHTLPQEFLAAYREFNSRWRSTVNQSRELWVVRGNDGEERITDNLWSILQSPSAIGPGVRVSHPAAHPAFNPSEDDAIASIGFALFWIENMIDDDSPSASNRDKAITAWDFLTSPGGVSLLVDGFAERWRSVPSLHVSTRTTGADNDEAGCFVAYEETARVFALGYYLAALALCRSTLQRALVSLYKAPHGDLKDQIDAKLVGENNNRAHDLRKAGNDAAHVGEVQGLPGRRDVRVEQGILGHLLLLQAVIQGAP